MSESSPDRPEGLRRFGTIFQPSAQAEDDVRLMVELLDLQDSAPPIRRLRDWALSAAQIRPAEFVVDVGSGSGTMAREFGGLVSRVGRVIGIEPNPRLRTLAAERAAEQANVEFLDGQAGSLPLADESVDLIWCERVLQHLADPQAAIDDFARVLRPGGRAVLLDSDHATRVSSDIEGTVETRINQAFMGLVPNPHAARLIPRQVVQAGLTVDPDVLGVALVMPPHVLLRGQWLHAAAEQGVTDGTITRDEADQAARAVADAARAGYAFSAVTVFGFVARKGSG